MKNKGELLRTKDGKYYKPEGSKETNEETKESKYDFTNFVQIKASSRKEPEEMLSVWTKAEFEQFITAVQDKPASYTAFMTMYYTGMRVGELCALTPADVDLKIIPSPSAKPSRESMVKMLSGHLKHPKVTGLSRYHKHLLIV